MTDWQPIETAPKDGELFLIYIPSAKTRKVSLSSGRDSAQSRFKRLGYTIYDDRGNPTRATHWMPLPEPPGE